jgi:sugar porter (SP) family MFS transporter
MPQRDSSSFTIYGWTVCTWVLVASFQYGYHISALNQIQAVLTCRNVEQGSFYGLPLCIPMSDVTFSVVTSIYTVGGLVGSIGANVAMDRWGRRGASRLSAVMTAIGSLFMAASSSIIALLVGRTLVGVGAGLGICVGPIYLAEIAPFKIRGSVGVLTQLSIVLGIMLTQSLGLYLSTPRQWRFVLLISSALSIMQLFLGPFIAESPSYLGRKGLLEEQKIVSRRLWGVIESASVLRRDDDNSLEDPLLQDAESQRDEAPHATAMTVPQLLKAPELRRPLLIVSLGMLSQQVSGINAVLYYSNAILSKALPQFGPYVSLGITIVNVIMTFPPIFLIERAGRRRLLQISVVGALVSHVAVGIGLNTGVVILSSIAVMTFVMSFAIGLGPVPFVLISEVSPPHAVSALSSVGLSLNWTANFLVGLIFLPLRNLLAGGDAMKEGRVFYVFAALLSVTAGILSKVYRG